MRKGLLLSIILGILLIGLVSAVPTGLNIIYPQDQNYGENITHLDWSFEGSLNLTTDMCWYQLDSGDWKNFNCDENVTGINSIEGDNNWKLKINDSIGSTVIEPVNFWVDSIEPSLSLVNPSSSISYTNTNTLTLIVNLFEKNSGYYSGTREIRRIFYYPDSIGGSHDANYDLDINNDSDASHTLWNPADRAEGNYSYIAYAKDIFPNGSTIREISLEGVIVRDLTPPVINLTGSNNITIEFNTSYNELGATATDNLEGDISDKIIIDNSSLNVNVIGTYVLYYDVNDSAGNSAETVNRTVNVIDSTPPVLTLLGDNPQEIEVGASYVELGANATDNYDGNLTDNITIDNSSINTNVLGSYEVLYSVNDSFGNSANATRIVNVVDNTPPVLTLIGNSTLTLERGVDTYVEYGANATDNYDGNLTDNISITNPVDMNIAGIYEVIYYVEDSSGNNDSKIRIVNVIDTIAPLIRIHSPENITYTINNIDLNVSTNELNCDWKYSLDDGLNNESFVPNESLSSLNLPNGDYNLTVYVEDEVGNENSSMVSFNINIPVYNPSSSGRSGGSCKTVWNCTLWSNWSECVNGSQYQTCLEKERVRCGDGIRLSVLEKGKTRNFCVIIKGETEEEPLEEVEEPNEDTSEKGFFSSMTGSAIGFAKSGTGILTLIVIGFLLVSWTVLHFSRKRFKNS